MNKKFIGLLWCLGILFILIITFGITQPLICQLIGQTPPAGTDTLANLLIITIMLITLGIAVFGGGLYYILSRRIQEEATKTAEKEYCEIQVRLNLHTSALWGRLYEGLQNIVSAEQLLTPIDEAVRYGERANSFAQNLDEKTHEKLILGAKNNYAMALALKGDLGTSKIAKDLVDYMQEKIERYPISTRLIFKETMGFVTWRLPRKRNDSLLAIKYLKEAMNESDEVMKSLFKRRWKQFPKGVLPSRG